MRRKILEAVQNIDWNAIDLLHCGSADFNNRHLVRPVILFVSVKPESTTRLEGRAVALKCRDVLQEHGINGVEVEIKESRITQCCSSDQDQAESSSPARFRDWALIELDQKKHQTLVKEFGNTVPETLSPVFKEPQYMLWEDFNPGRMRAICVVPGAHIYTQAGVMSEAEMRCPDFDFAVPGKTVVDEDFMGVCMYGSASGASHGVTNTARHGDSGASVMGDDGRVAAILTSGAQGSNRGIHHISYAAPIEWLLEDIRGHGYDVEWMGKEIPLDYLHNRL
nr:hypothetical protein FVER53263_12237 [Fusarium verticillioides]